MRFVIVASSLLVVAAASFCGQSAVPFTFQVLRAGYPVLGCARPRCFGWTIDGQRANDTAQFYRVNGKEDGYMRRSDELSAPAQPVVRNQIAECDAAYRTSSCESGEWLGGLAPVTDIGSKTVLKRCCRYEGLFETEDRGIATVHNGQLVVGGEVTQHGRVVAFDYISDMVKEVADNGTVSYSVSIRRMPCFDEPTHDLVDENAIVGGTQPEDQSVQNIEAVHRRVAGVPLSPQQPLPLQPLPQTPPPQPSPTPSPVPQTISQYAVQQTAQPSQGGQQEGQQGQQSGYNTQQQQINNGYQNYYQQQQTTVDPMTALFGSNPLAELFKNPPAMQLPNLFAPPPQQPQQAFGAQDQTQQYAQQVPQQAAAPGFYQQTQQYNTQQQQQPVYAQSQQNAATIQPQSQQGYGNGVEQMMQSQQQQQSTGQYQQGQQQYQPQQQTQYTQTQQPEQLPALPTLPPLGELPKLPDIPSPEEVEQNMPPVQRAILTSVANFFGVL